MKSMMTGESFFTTIYTAKRDGQTLAIAPEFTGDVLDLDVSETPTTLPKGLS